jgi:hypothetical protein
MPPSSTGRSIEIEDSDRKALRAAWRIRPMKLRGYIGAATSRAIEHIFFRHTPAIMPLRTYETEPFALRKRGGGDQGQTRAESQK